jgi:hypothetical protein
VSNYDRRSRRSRRGAQAVTAAAWYPDPWQHAEQRYWDGATWTTHVMTGGVAHIDLPSGPSAS